MSLISKSGVGITGLGRYIPKNIVTNETIAKKYKINPDIIAKRSGVLSRCFASSGETASWMSAQSAHEAMKNAKIKASEIGLIIGLTTSGDYVFPALASKVQDLIGAKKSGAFDLSASASSFPIAVSLAADRLRCDPNLKNILVFGTAVQSPYINWRNEELASILGDASGAAVLSCVPEGFGVIASEIHSDGSHYEAARLRGGGSLFPLCSDNIDQNLQFIEMDGVVMGREFLKTQPTVIQKALGKAGLKIKDVSLFIFHQANLRLIQYVMKGLNQPMTSTITNVENLGNTAEASIPTALYDAAQKGMLKKGDIVALSGVGAGSIIAVTVLRWQ